jgi:orotate phosphoribosyltransferase
MNRLSDILIESGIVRSGEFILSSGIKSNKYIDIKHSSTNPTVLKRITEEILVHIKDPDRIAGMELGAIPLITSSSIYSGIPFLMIRKSIKSYGTSSQIEGPFEMGMKVIVIEDVTSTGKSSIQTVQILRESGLIVNEVISVIDRKLGAEQALSDIGVKLTSLVSSDELGLN